jgi:pimeloyl-ACP methyl ester carboxylesterase
MRCVKKVYVERRLHEISLPTLIIHGDRDLITPLAEAQTLAAKIAGESIGCHRGRRACADGHAADRDGDGDQLFSAEIG